MRRISCFTGAILVGLLALAQPAIAQRAEPGVPPAHEVPIAILLDVSSGQVLHQRNAQRRFVPASMAKTMTAFLAFELIEEGRLSLDQHFRFSPRAFAGWGGTGSTMFLNANDSVSVAQLLMGITTVSANDASVVLAEGAAGSLAEWSAWMNAKARELDMAESHFYTPNGWPDEGRTFVTARDLAVLGRELTQRHPELYRRFFGHRSFAYRGIVQRNRDPFSGQVSGGDGIKTGFTNEAGFGFLGSAERGGRRLVLVVAGAETARVRNRAARSYLEWGFTAFESRPLFARGETVFWAKVQGGAARSVALVARQAVSASVPRGSAREPRLQVHYEGPLRAPIAKGQRVAELEIAVEGMEPSHIPLYAAEDVSEASLLARVANGIIGWFT